jgi:hypothetical protein
MEDDAGSDEAEAREFGRQAEVAADALRAAALRLLQKGEVDPRLIVLAAARVVGELAAATALAAGQDGDVVLADVIEVARRSCREHREALEAATLRVAGNA